MEKHVKQWLLAKAKEDLGAAREQVGECEAMVKEYEKRVVDPDWNQYHLPDDTEFDPKRPGEKTWGGEVKEWKKELRAARKQLALMENVVKELTS